MTQINKNARPRITNPSGPRPLSGCIAEHDEALPAVVYRSPAVAKVLNASYNQAGKCVVTLEVGSTTISLEINSD